MNAVDKWVTTATIRDEPRRALWQTVFSDGVIPIKSIFTSKLSVPEHHQDVDCYMLDLDALSERQLAGVIAVMSIRFSIHEDDVRSELHKGVPILAEGVSVSSADQRLLFSIMGDDDVARNVDKFFDE